VPELQAVDRGDHLVACHFPVHTAQGEAALSRNKAAGISAAGLTIRDSQGEMAWLDQV
jgi:hypothetical protein